MRQKKLQKILFVTDAHVPYQDHAALNLIHKTIRKIKPDVLCILGDFADFYSVSAHDKSPDRSLRLTDEVASVRKELSRFEKYKFKRKIFISGNHENRLERYISSRAPELFGLVTIPELFKLRQNGWEYVPYKRHVMIGNLAVSHDYGSAGATAHKTASQRLGNPVVIGHTHRAGTVSRRNLDGDLVMSGMFGWLGDVSQIDYAHSAQVGTDWVSGFGIGYMNQKGVVVLNSVPILGNSCVVEGQLIEVSK
tara:strand:+ start:1986 stop:2738 length:753 start_codon:yes stop_codon:yes gene_type:complete